MYSVRGYSLRVALPSTIILSKATTIRKGTVMLPENEAGYIDAGEAARLLGVSQHTMRNLVAQRRLEVKREGAAARVVVSSASLERLHSERQAVT
jgi:hypothetical protein